MDHTTKLWFALLHDGRVVLESQGTHLQKFSCFLYVLVCPKFLSINHSQDAKKPQGPCLFWLLGPDSKRRFQTVRGPMLEVPIRRIIVYCFFGAPSSSNSHSNIVQPENWNMTILQLQSLGKKANQPKAFQIHIETSWRLLRRV